MFYRKYPTKYFKYLSESILFIYDLYYLIKSQILIQINQKTV